MDAYKTPGAQLVDDFSPPFKPIRALIYGCSITIVVVSLIGLLEGIAFGVILGVNITDYDTFESALAGNALFLTVDIIISSLIYIWAGRVVGKHVPGKEIVFATVLVVITLAIFLPFYVATGQLHVYPVWYTLVSYLMIILAIYFGARSTIT